MNIVRLQTIDAQILELLKCGYLTNEIYTVERQGNREQMSFTVKLTTLDEPYVKTWDDAYTSGGVSYYQRIVDQGWSFAVLSGDELAAVAICEPRRWNKTLHVYEFHVSESHRRQGYGRGLMDFLARQAKAEDLRTMVCEVQNTNVPALDFYRSVGFQLEALDLTLYANNPGAQGEIAFFMKRQVD